MKTYLRKIAFTFVLLAALVLPTSSAQAQLQEVKQTVFGMDCAPCAYGLEKQMKGFEGVESASVSLNDGLATLQLAPKNNLRLEKLRTAIEESGFSARQATIRVTGTLEKSDGQWTLVTPAGERYRLEQSPENASNVNLSEITTGQVTVTGKVPKGKKPSNKSWTFQVATLHSTS